MVTLVRAAPDGSLPCDWSHRRLKRIAGVSDTSAGLQASNNESDVRMPAWRPNDESPMLPVIAPQPCHPDWLRGRLSEVIGQVS